MCVSVCVCVCAGALRVMAELLVTQGLTTMYLPDPTWANHKPLLQGFIVFFLLISFYLIFRGQSQTPLLRGFSF